MELRNIQRVYMVGIGGIGMSGLARYFNHLGCMVCGYDKTATPLTDELQREGISIVFDDKAELIPAPFHQPDAGTLVIYTPAIPQKLRDLKFFERSWFRSAKTFAGAGHHQQGHVCHCRCGHAW